ncbi:MAG: cysteine--tRNA ligase [Chloroflexi bacterium]|nr:cysteine--tRNA ligase [Chloroflexota bacterium]
MRLYDTLSGEVQGFAPVGDEVKMYVCGPTPYDVTHLGHAMSYVVFDVLRRYLEHRGFRVRHVQNFTDIDDKLIARAVKDGVTVQALAERHIQGFLGDMDDLNVLRAHVYPRATQEIPAMVQVVQGLLGRGHAYVADGDVYFRVQKAPGYGKLSRRTLEGMVAGARVEPSEHKEHPLDFALWKRAKPGEPSWESPWGQGRPGWHIECTAMSLRYLGTTLDIHGGGQDLVFPHHENEIAQSERYTGVTPFVRFWVHNGLLRLGEEKMSKSVGNLIPVREALQRYSADAIRLFFLNSHYRSPLTFSEEDLAARERATDRIRTALRPAAYKEGERAFETEGFRLRFMAAMDEDLNTPQALSVLFELVHEINQHRDAGGNVAEGQALLQELGGVLGLTFQPRRSTDNVALQPFLELLVEVRARLRDARQYALADTIRSRLADLGVALEDTPQGTLWRFQGPRLP